MYKKIMFGALLTLGLFTHHVGADGQISKIETHTNTVVLTFNTTSGKEYQVQCTTNLASGIWMDVGNAFTAEAGQGSKTITSPDKSCFFRIVSLYQDPNSDAPPPPDAPPSPPNYEQPAGDIPQVPETPPGPPPENPA